MSCYISSNNNRLFVALESTFGTVPGITGQNRIPAVALKAKQVQEQTSRRDKTGSRTFVGLPNTIRKKTNFQLNTFLTQWDNQTVAPAYGPLFQAAMGAAPLLYSGRPVASVTTGTQVQFSAPHGLIGGQAVRIGGEIRFVTAIQDASTVFVNAPF